MQFKIRNYRAVSSIDIELAKIVLLSGKNAAGKTSAIDAIRCAAIGAANPFKEITKKQASMLVHSGTPAGYAEIIEGENVIRIDWPECKASSNGKPVNISEVAAGIVSLADMNSPDRINYIVKMMNANPTEADLAKEMARLFPPDILISTSDSFARLWENISINGWDNAYKQIREKGRKLKAKWELTTGCKDYGKRIAEQWTPEAWSLDLETIKESELTAGVNKAKEWAEAAIKETAISEHEQKQLKKAAANITLLSSGCDVLEKQHDATESEKHKKMKEKSTLEGSFDDVILTCPACKEKLTIKNNKLIKVSKKPANNKKKIAEIDNAITALKKQQEIILKNWSDKKAELRIAENASEKLNSIESEKSDNTEAKIEDAKNRLELAENRLKAFRDYRDAQKIADDIILNKKISDILAPDGLRNKLLKSALDKINKSMRMLCDYVGWKTVELNNNCDILCNGIPFGRLIAKSERYRTRVLLQLMVAMAEKPAFIIIDDADELTKSVRNGLMKVILESKIDSIIVSALNDKKDMPDLDKIGGRSHWIENGRIN